MRFTHTVNADISADCLIAEVLYIIEKCNGRIISHQASGPGGGNPNITVAFDNRDDAFNYACEHFSDGSDSDEQIEWINEQVVAIAG